MTTHKLLDFYKGFDKGFFDYGDRHFNFHMPTAWDGCRVFCIISSYRIPFMLGVPLSASAKLPPIPSELLRELQVLCLQNTTEQLQNGSPQVIDADGGIATTKEVNGPLAYHLTTAYLLFFEKNWGEEDLWISSLSRQDIVPQKQ
jgi:hypothetical protein